MAGTVEGMEVALNMGDDAWNDLVSSGQVVDVLVTGKFTEEPDVWAGFLVTGLVLALKGMQPGLSVGACDKRVVKLFQSKGWFHSPMSRVLCSFWRQRRF